MKVFQVENGICFYDMTHMYDSAAQAATHYPPTLLIVDAPDNVHEGWAFDGENFTPPTMEGKIYDETANAFYDEGGSPPKPVNELDKTMKQSRALAEVEGILSALLGENEEAQA